MITIMFFIGTTLMYAAPLIFASIGGVISERAGVVNIGIEGMMTIGAFVAATVTCFTQNPILGFFLGGLAGMLLALLHAVASITALSDQTMSGIALNFIGPGLSIFICGRIFGTKSTDSVPALAKPFNEIFSGTDFGPIGRSVDISVIFALITLVIVWVFLYKTKWGLRLRAIGEHPAAADTLGVNVSAVRYCAVLASGFLAGLGGAVLALSISSQFDSATVSGQGYTALAAVILGKWTPHGACLACLLFGFAQSLSLYLNNDSVSSIVPESIFPMIPYLMTIIVLVIFVGRAVAPKSDGIPYRRGDRN